MFITVDLSLTQQDASPSRRPKIELVGSSISLSGQPYIPSNYERITQSAWKGFGHSNPTSTILPTNLWNVNTLNHSGVERDGILSESEINNMILLMASYKKELKRLKNNEPELIQSLSHFFSYFSKVLFKLPFQNCAVEIISNEIIKFSLSFENEKLLMIKKELNSSDEIKSLDEVFYSYFINGNLIASDVTNLEVFAENFKRYISA